jgi:hypothetical protein
MAGHPRRARRTDGAGMTGSGTRPAQWFHFGPWAFSIDEAVALIAGSPREPHSLNVAAWANAFGLTHIDDAEPHTINLIGPTPGSFNRNHAMNSDLTIPVIVATVGTDDEPSPLLIDGVHRLYRAWKQHETYLPAYVLSLHETRLIQHGRFGARSWIALRTYRGR